MSAPLTCGCRGEVILGNTNPCPDPATQEDLLCDWCRVRDCPTVDAFNVIQRDAKANAATWAPMYGSETVVPF